MKYAKNGTSSETNVRLDLDCSTELNITHLDDHKPNTTLTYRIETNLLKQIRDILVHTQKSQQSQVDDQECRNSWMMVAMVLDRFLLLVFTLLTIVVSLVLLLNHPTYGYSHLSQPLDTTDWWRLTDL